MFGYSYALNDQFFNQFRRRMMDLFDESAPTHLSTWPPANLYDNGESMVLQMEVPGMLEEDLNITIVQDVLTLTGERKNTLPEGVHLHRRERPVSRFSRSFTLPYRISPDKVQADLNNGLLTVMLPKHPEEQARSIQIGVGKK
jgi:HSP20 family protein